MYHYFRTINIVDLAIIAHCGHKRYPVPVPKHSVTNVIGVLVAYAIEVIGLGSHVILNVLDVEDSLHKPAQR